MLSNVSIINNGRNVDHAALVVQRGKVTADNLTSFANKSSLICGKLGSPSYEPVINISNSVFSDTVSAASQSVISLYYTCGLTAENVTWPVSDSAFVSMRGDIAGDGSIPSFGIPIKVTSKSSDLQIYGSLSVAAGNVFKFIKNAGLTIKGKLEVDGTAENPVVFTSFQDDVGGNTNPTDTEPAAADWDGLRFFNFNDVSPQSVLKNVQVRYGGRGFVGKGYEKGNIYVGQNGSVLFDNLSLGESPGRCIYIQDNGRLEIINSDLSGCSTVVIENINKEQAVIAKDNYWGDATGPLHSGLNPEGLGGEVKGLAEIEPWLVETQINADEGQINTDTDNDDDNNVEEEQLDTDDDTEDSDNNNDSDTGSDEEPEEDEEEVNTDDGNDSDDDNDAESQDDDNSPDQSDASNSSNTDTSEDEQNNSSSTDTPDNNNSSSTDTPEAESGEAAGNDNNQAQETKEEEVPQSRPFIPVSPVLEVSVSASRIFKGESAQLRWGGSNLSYVQIRPGFKIFSGAGTLDVSPNETTEYRLEAVNDGIVVTKSVTVFVEPYDRDPVVVVPGILGSWPKPFYKGGGGEMMLDPVMRVYDDLLNTLRLNGYKDDETLYKFPYQWRNSNEITWRLLKNEITRIKNVCKCSKVDVVAHSMGGLVTRAYVQSDTFANDIDQVIFLGAPHKGAPKTYLAWEGGEGGGGIMGWLFERKFAREARQNKYKDVSLYIREKVKSVGQLLPIFDYLKTANNGLTLKYNPCREIIYPCNSFLENLEANKHKTSERVNVVNLISDNAGSTLASITVEPIGFENNWRHGKPTQKHNGGGDGTVPTFSANSLGGNVAVNNIDHTALPSALRGPVTARLLNKNSVAVSKPIPMVKRVFFVDKHSPINLEIIDPDGNVVGLNGQNEQENVYYTGPQEEDEYIVIANPLDGEYKVKAYGTGEGYYEVVVSMISEEGTTEQVFSGEAVIGSEDEIGMVVAADNSISPIGLADEALAKLEPIDQSDEALEELNLANPISPIGRIGPISLIDPVIDRPQEALTSSTSASANLAFLDDLEETKVIETQQVEAVVAGETDTGNNNVFYLIILTASFILVSVLTFKSKRI